MLVIGGTNDPVTPYHGALATYHFIGENNAQFLVHDAFGHCTTSSPNFCTESAIHTFLTTGTYFLNRTNLGALPPNGTVCRTDYTGTNSIFMNVSDINANSADVIVTHNRSLNLSLGLGFGLGIPLLLGMCVLLRLLYTRRNGNGKWMELGSSGKPAKENEEKKQIDSGWPLIGEKGNKWI